jgi:hypothetical protein
MRKGPIALALALLATIAAPVLADHSGDLHSGNIQRVATFTDGGTYRQGTDLGFWRDTMVAGNFDNPGGFRLIDVSKPTKPKKIGQFECFGNQADVSIWRDLVVVSVDDTLASPKCGAGKASQDQVLTGTHWEGIRIVSIKNPAKPRQVATVFTDCGSHTHTLVPDPKNNRVLVYVLSYPISGQGVTCNYTTHQKFSIVKIPLAKPGRARVVSTPSVAPAIGCHDVTVLRKAKLAAAACLTESQMWDISKPAKPKVIAHIPNPPEMNLAHSTAFSLDGDTIVIGDELGGALATPGCLGQDHASLGALWFYDVSDPTAPQQRGKLVIPQKEPSLFCTAHNFNVIPLKTDRDVLVSGWYNGGTTVIDFTDPSAPRQLAYYIPKDGGQAGSWSSYWYNGYIYSNNYDEHVYSASAGGLPLVSRGIDVYRLKMRFVSKAKTLSSMNAQTQ